MLFFRAHYTRMEAVENDDQIEVSAAGALEEGSGLKVFNCFFMNGFGTSTITDELAFPPTTQYIPTAELMRQMILSAVE